MKVLIIGLGSIAQKHIQALTNISSGEISLYALRSSALPNQVPDITNISSIGEAGVSFDFVIVSNPTFSHYDTLRKLLDYNIPLFIEKPLFHTLDGGQQLVDQIISSKVKTYIACNLRFHPCIVFIKDLLRQKRQRINEVNIYAGSYLPDWRPGIDYRQVYSANEKMGGGVHLDLIHELDYVTWLWGTPNSSAATLRSTSSLNIDAVDYANYLLQYEQFTVNIVLNYYRRDTKRTCEILFEDNTVSIDLIKQKVWCNEELIFSSDIDPLYTYKEQMKYFISAIKEDNGYIMNDIQSAFNVLKICLNDEQVKR
ncbi:Gfo/Idh/MocA family protein [Chitinophaga sp. RCC_12]|uniref:Gfo/Idh/MocA family protein n=1 Tax=Chitinophaga sp. RCC_12 TaxID=3239226 RepID=UPI0035261A96